MFRHFTIFCMKGLKTHKKQKSFCIKFFFTAKKTSTYLELTTKKAGLGNVLKYQKRQQHFFKIVKTGQVVVLICTYMPPFYFNAFQHPATQMTHLEAN